MTSYEIKTIDLEGTKVRALILDGEEYLEALTRFSDVETGEDLDTFVTFDEEDNAIYAVICKDGTVSIEY